MTVRMGYASWRSVATIPQLRDTLSQQRRSAPRPVSYTHLDVYKRQARALDLPITIFAPDYGANGKLAPLIRNQKIVDYADLVLAFWDHHSRGTAYTLNYCIQTHKPFRIIGLHP